MKSFFAIIAGGLDAVRIALSKSKMEKTAAAVVVGVVGIGLLASPFLVQANDEETNNAPSVLQINVQNHGSIGFDVEFDVSVPWADIDDYDRFRLFLDGIDGQIVEGYPRNDTLESEAPNQGWLEIPGYDGGPPLPYPGYVHSFDYTIKALKAVEVRFIPLASPSRPPFSGFWFVEYETFEVDISLYVGFE